MSLCTHTHKNTPSLINCYCISTVYKSFTTCLKSTRNSIYNPFYFMLQDKIFIHRIFKKINLMYEI